jgi:hypothetical protein
MNEEAKVVDALRGLFLAGEARLESTGLHDVAEGRAIGDGPSAEVCATLHAGRETVRGWLERVLAGDGAAGGSGSFEEGPASFLAARVVRVVQRHNQFLDLGPARVRALERLFAASLRAVSEASVGTSDAATFRASLELAFSRHDREIARFVAEMLEDASDVAGFARLRVPCATYRPETQLAVLGLDPATMRQPVLDLGCGEEASLVRHLRAAGVAAFGVDRVARPQEHVEVADWFEATLAPGAWGTIVSHLGFSLHFVHHHLRSSERARRYATRYMEILRALSEGGAFVYAPGLPFIEPLLPADQYRVSRRAVELPEGVAHLGEGAYAARVERTAR